MSTQSTAAAHDLEESNIILQSPSFSDAKYMTDLSNMFNLDPTNNDDLIKAETQISPHKTQFKSSSPQQTITSALFPTLQNESSTLEDGNSKYGSMSPSDSYSIISSPQTLNWPSSSESGDSDHWALRHELLPGQAHQTGNSPASPASSWDCPAPFQFHNGPTSAAFPHDYSLPFTATTPSSMQASYSPVFEEASMYGSPQCPTSHYDEVASLHKRALSFGMSDVGAVNVACPSQPLKLSPSQSSFHTAPTNGGDLAVDGISATPGLMSRRADELDKKPYSQLLYMAFMSSPTKRMQLKAIYEWFNQNTNKSQSKGWQNSIRHNLSMNMAFKKAELKEDGTESKRSTEWVLQDWAVKRGVESTTRYRKSTNLRGRKPNGLVGGRGRLTDLSQAACRSSLGLMGCSSRARDRLYSQRMNPGMHEIPNSHLLYSSCPTTTATPRSTATTISTPPPPAPQHSLLDVAGIPDVGGYMAPQEGGMMGSDQVHGMDDYQEFAPDYISISPENYPMYPGQGNMNMGEPLMGSGGVLGDNGLTGAVHGGGDNILASSPSMGMNMGMQASMPMQLAYGSHFPSNGTEQMAESQPYHPYTPAEYSMRQGEADMICDWPTN